MIFEKIEKKNRNFSIFLFLKGCVLLPKQPFVLAWNFTLLQNFFLIVSQNSMIFLKKIKKLKKATFLSMVQVGSQKIHKDFFHIFNSLNWLNWLNLASGWSPPGLHFFNSH